MLLFHWQTQRKEVKKQMEERKKEEGAGQREYLRAKTLQNRLGPQKQQRHKMKEAGNGRGRTG